MSILADESHTKTKENDSLVSYLPPCNKVLEGLGITTIDLNSAHVKVSTAYLKFLISEVIRSVPVNSEWYAQENPDVHGAILASVITSAHEHFVKTGYFENRLPAELPFDASWYYSYYKDLASVYSQSDASALRRHFFSRGYFEGRVGVPQMLEAANRWNAAVSAPIF